MLQQLFLIVFCQLKHGYKLFVCQYMIIYLSFYQLFYYFLFENELYLMWLIPKFLCVHYRVFYSQILDLTFFEPCLIFTFFYLLHSFDCVHFLYKSLFLLLLSQQVIQLTKYQMLFLYIHFVLSHLFVAVKCYKLFILAFMKI